jgi:uncharacterized membrane protein (DUF485 family)
VSATDDGQSGSPALDDPTPYQEVQRSPEFVALRKRWRRFIFTLSAIFLAWFMVYVLLADFATGFMNTRIGGTNLTIGLVFGLLQFVSTFVIATIYVRFADKNLDPEAERLRLRVEEKL